MNSVEPRYGLSKTDQDKASQYTCDVIRSIQLHSKKKYEPPRNLDGRVVWSGLLPVVKQQGNCNSCWAIATTNMLESRINILSKNLGNPIRLSSYKALLCNWSEDSRDVFYNLSTDVKNNILDQRENSPVDTYAVGCESGLSIVDALDYLFVYGVPTYDCVPGHDVMITNTNRDKCEDILGRDFDTCIDGRTVVFNYKAGVTYLIEDNPESYQHLNDPCYSVKWDIMKFGPCVVGAFLHYSFGTFPANVGSVFDVDANETVDRLIGHMMLLVGWKHDEAYGGTIWILQNSWGSSYGDNGYVLVSARSLHRQYSHYGGLVPDIGNLSRSKMVQSFYNTRLRTSDENDVNAKFQFSNKEDHAGFPISGQYKVAHNLLVSPFLFDESDILDIDEKWAHIDGRNTSRIWINVVVVVCTLLLLFVTWLLLRSRSKPT